MLCYLNFPEDFHGNFCPLLFTWEATWWWWWEVGNLAKWDFKDKMPRKYVESFEFCFLALSHRLDQISVLIGDGIDATLYWCVCEHLFCVCV